MRYSQTQKPMLGQQINWAHPLAKGLVGCWLFNESSGLYVSDLSGNNNRGILVNHAHFESGRSGPALSFDGTDDYVNTGSPASLNLNNNFTISARIKGTVNVSGGIVYWGEEAAGKRRSLTLWNGGSGTTYYFYFSGYGASANLSSGVGVGDNVWHHIVATLDSSNHCKTYTDGVFRTEADLTLLAYTYGGTNIGRTLGLEYFNGLIDYVRIYNRALSTQEVWQLYAFPYAMFERRPVWMDYVAAGGLSIPVAVHHYKQQGMQ